MIRTLIIICAINLLLSTTFTKMVLWSLQPSI